MAIKLENKTNIIAPDGAYPFGRMRDNDGSGNGTPANEAFMNDYVQFFAKMLEDSGLAANGLPDNQTNGFQYFQALLSLFGKTRKVIVDIGTWNMDANSIKAIAIPAGVTAEKIRSLEVIIRDDENEAGYYDFKSPGNVLDPIAGDSGIYYSSLLGIVLSRLDGGSFDSNIFDRTDINRGWVTITYDAS